MIDHREIKFEESIEHYLTNHGGYSKADPKNFDRDLALDPTVLLPFIRQSQPAKWKVIADYCNNADTVCLAEVTRTMDARGSLDVLRHGVDFFGKNFALAFFRPSHGMNPDAERGTTPTASPSPASFTTAPNTTSRLISCSASTASPSLQIGRAHV